MLREENREGEEQSTPCGHSTHVQFDFTELLSSRYCIFGSQSSGNFHAGRSHPFFFPFGTFPSRQDVHCVCPRASLYVFAGHGVHIPGALPKVPSSHLEHTALPKVEDSPFLQSKHTTASSIGPRYFPLSQSTHGVPARPGIQSTQETLPLMDDLPIAQSKHVMDPCTEA